ncbi:MAG: ATP-binding protein [Flavobacteriales bacterium]|nr:ATP-binding protein [Flavobacteriales bacterium]
MRRIVITGPESSGKTTLCRLLAMHFGVPWVVEQARGYLDAIGRPYVEADLLIIARSQIGAEEAVLQMPRPYCCAIRT